MASHNRLEQTLIEWAEPIAEAEGYIVVDIRVQGPKDRPRILVALDKVGGVQIDDCSHFSRLFGARLDIEEDLIPGSYLLEVSSPGLDRTLRSDRELTLFQGREVQVRTFAPVEGQKEFVGYLESADPQHIVIRDEEELRHIPRDMVSRIKLHFQP